MKSSLVRAAIAALSLFLSMANALAADWPMLGRDGTRNPVSLEKPAPLHWQVEEWENGKVIRPASNVLWEAKLGSISCGAPVISGGLVWIGTNNRNPRDPKFKGDVAVLMGFRES